MSEASGRQIAKLDVDGVCGPLTLAAILAAQRSLNVWRHCAVDRRIDAIKEGGASQYEGGAYYDQFDRVNGKLMHHVNQHIRFNTMYILAIGAEASMLDYGPVAAQLRAQAHDPLDALYIYSLPDPLKTSLFRSALVNAVGPFIGHAQNR